jgi:hypothetical protein
MTQTDLRKIIREAQERQNDMSMEIVAYLKLKQKELIPLTQKIISAQDILYRKYNDSGDYDEPNEAFDILYDLSNGKLFGYMLSDEEISEVMRK